MVVSATFRLRMQHAMTRLRDFDDICTPHDEGREVARYLTGSTRLP